VNDIEPDGAFGQLVLYRLNSLAEDIAELRGDVADVRTEVVGVRIDVATLKVKAGIWGGAAGCVPALIGVAAIVLGGGGA